MRTTENSIRQTIKLFKIPVIVFNLIFFINLSTPQSSNYLHTSTSSLVQIFTLSRVPHYLVQVPRKCIQCYCESHEGPPSRPQTAARSLRHRAGASTRDKRLLACCILSWRYLLIKRCMAQQKKCEISCTLLSINVHFSVLRVVLLITRTLRVIIFQPPSYHKQNKFRM